MIFIILNYQNGGNTVPEKFQQSLKFSSGVGHLTYEEYSAELQIELLN